MCFFLRIYPGPAARAARRPQALQYFFPGGQCFFRHCCGFTPRWVRAHPGPGNPRHSISLGFFSSPFSFSTPFSFSSPFSFSLLMASSHANNSSSVALSAATDSRTGSWVGSWVGSWAGPGGGTTVGPLTDGLLFLNCFIKAVILLMMKGAQKK